MNLQNVLQALYESEINAGVSSFWDGGWMAWIGDEINGRKAAEQFEPGQLDYIGVWLDKAAREVYPDSAYALGLTPICVEAVDTAAVKLRATKPIILAPRLDATSGYLTLEHEKLGVSIYAKTRPELWRELNRQFAVLWSEYALADDEILTGDARGLKRDLKAAFYQVPAQ